MKPPRTSRERTRVRCEIALVLRKRELSYKEIGARLGLSVRRVSELLRPPRPRRESGEREQAMR